MNDLVVRGCEAADAGSIVSLNQRVVAEKIAPSGFLILPLGEQQVLLEIGSGEVLYALCELGGVVVGFVKYGRRVLPEYRDADGCRSPVDLAGGVHIEKIAVAREHRGCGVGRALYRFVQEHSQPTQLYSFITVSPCINEASVRFHEALGFVRREVDVPYEMPDGSWFLDRLYVLETGRTSESTVRGLANGTSVG